LHAVDVLTCARKSRRINSRPASPWSS